MKLLIVFTYEYLLIYGRYWHIKTLICV